ncbi:zinc finger protein 37-like isoform X3 [Micropterus salmoides]|uniref:zinc finger protein 37-like isoform X3 n=1 Tax=Micropterus salmoides TaxID=27706 RepID=UPI0018EBCB34|nr:zinc finger protein 37-like isoform X3 [Micropterus salmoides]
MVYCVQRNSGGSGTLDSPNNMSKTEILRGIVTEKLTTAAQEIFAVVERTVAGYEEEASGLRQEIDRQRRQLEAVLQPRVKLETREYLIPDPEGHEAVVREEEQQKEEQTQQSEALIPDPKGHDNVVREEEQTQQSGEEDSGSLGQLWYDDDEEGDGGNEELQLSVQPATSLRKEDLKDPDFQIESRLSSPRDASVRRKPGRSSLRQEPDHHLLRVYILEDSQSDCLSKNVFQKYPVQELQCPRGLQEADFLDLLRSTFPQLAGDNKPFEVFKSDRSRRLQPLEVKTLTPEEIFRSIRLTGAGYSALYIRLKTGEEELRLLQGNNATTESSSTAAVVIKSNEAGLSSGVLSPRDSSVRRQPGRPRLRVEPNHHLLRVCVLEDSQSDVLSKNVFQKYPVQKLQCPRDLQEADFLDLLRSTFPQLAGHNKPFEVFKSDWSKRLQPLKVKTLTPEEIFRSMRLTGAGHSALYIRLKTGEEEELHLLQRGAASTDFPSTVQSDEAGLSSSCSVQHVEGDKVDVQSSSSTSQQQDMETEEADDEDAAESQVDSSDDADKDGDEAFNGDDDWKPDPDLQSPKKRKKKESNLSGVKGQLIGSSKTPCKVCGLLYRNLGSLIKHAWSHVEKSQLVCGVCGEQFESVEELKGHLRNYQKSHDCSHCGKSFLTKTSLNSHTTLHTGDRPFKCDVCHKTFGRLSTLCAHRWVHVADKPHKCDICPKAFGLKTQLKAHSMIHTGRDKYHCNICGKSVYDRRSLTRHKATHSVERRYGCELCGKRFKGPAGLKSHEKVHASRDRPYLCHICCKTFVEKSSLKTHMLTHSNDRPFICSICSKGFKSSAKLNVHMRVHTDEAPYSCSECGRCFKHKTYLTNHVRTHLGIKRFVCGVCGKACFRQEHLKVHMRTHNGEKPYKCTVCDKAFTQSHCLKTHKKSHQGEENLFLNASTS